MPSMSFGNFFSVEILVQNREGREGEKVKKKEKRERDGDSAREKERGGHGRDRK